MDLHYLLEIAIILLFTRTLGSFTSKLNLTFVVGALCSGILIGPLLLGIVKDSQYLDNLAEIGVILLLFIAGMETDLNVFKREGKNYVIIAVAGVIIPLLGGMLGYYVYINQVNPEPFNMAKAVFLGVVLSATSVSITVETLRELGCLTSSFGSAIIGAAIVDDLIGIVLLSMVLNVSNEEADLASILTKFALYFVLIFFILYACKQMRGTLKFSYDENLYVVYALALVLVFVYASEKYFDIADVTGAFMAGLVINTIGATRFVAKDIDKITTVFFAPIFFASVGIRTAAVSLSTKMILFAIFLIVIAIVSKMAGAAIGAAICRYSRSDCANIGIGMISRGEVALIVTQKGSAVGLIDPYLFPIIILVVILTTLITPVALKMGINHSLKKQELIT